MVRRVDMSTYLPVLAEPMPGDLPEIEHRMGQDKLRVKLTLGEVAGYQSS